MTLTPCGPHSIARHLVIWRIAALAMALAAYKAKQGNYPETLAALSPKYVQKVPLDLFFGKPLRYERTPNGYLLYGVGPNRKDEGGEKDDVSVGVGLELSLEDF